MIHWDEGVLKLYRVKRQLKDTQSHHHELDKAMKQCVIFDNMKVKQSASGIFVLLLHFYDFPMIFM